VTFTPTPGTVVQEATATAQFVVVTGDGGKSALGLLQATFSNTATAVDFSVVSMDPTQAVTVALDGRWYSPNAFQSASFSKLSSPAVIPNQGTWTVVTGQGAATVTFSRGSGATGNVFSIDYVVVDSTGNNMAATMTVVFAPPMRMRPRAADVLFQSDPSQLSTKMAAVNVLDRCSSWYAKDPKSVVLLGVQDISGQQTQPGVLLSDDGKTLRVQGEGVWLVDDSGNVGF